MLVAEHHGIVEEKGGSSWPGLTLVGRKAMALIHASPKTPRVSIRARGRR